MNLTEESKDMDYGFEYVFSEGIHYITDGINSVSFGSKNKEEAITEAKRLFTQWNHERANPQLYSKYFNVKTGFKVLQEDVNRNPLYFDNSQDFDEVINEEEGE